MNFGNYTTWHFQSFSVPKKEHKLLTAYVGKYAENMAKTVNNFRGENARNSIGRRSRDILNCKCFKRFSNEEWENSPVRKKEKNLLRENI